jgi:hypothetical protein
MTTTNTNVLNYEGELQDVWIHPSGMTSQNDTTAMNPVGCLHRHAGNVYRYVKFDNGNGNVASVAGAPAYWYALTPYNAGATAPLFTVTSDYSYGLGANAVAGAFIAVNTDGCYIWIQVAGVVTSAPIDTSSVAGSRHLGGADSVWTLCSSNAENEPFAQSLAADTAGVGPIVLMNCYW